MGNPFGGPSGMVIDAPIGWTAPIAPEWSTVARCSVAQSPNGGIIVNDNATANRLYSAGRPRANTNALTHAVEIEWCSIGASPNSEGISCVTAADWYFWSPISTGLWYEWHESAGVIVGTSTTKYHYGRIPRFWKQVIPAGAGAQTVSIEWSLDGVTWRVFTTKSLAVTATGVSGIVQAVNGINSLRVIRESYVQT